MPQNLEKQSAINSPLLFDFLGVKEASSPLAIKWG